MTIKWKNKYGNVKIKYAGFLFDSGIEKHRYQDLILLEAAGEIRDLKVHPKFTLQEGFRDRGGRAIQAVTVKWDFYYTKGSQAYVEDVKSPATRKLADYNIRKRLFIAKFPNIVFKEV